MARYERKRAAFRVAGAVAAVLAVGTVGYVLIEGASLLDALYMTVITVTTIGYREVVPLTDAGKVFTILLALTGVGILMYAITAWASLFVATDLRKILGLRGEQRMIGKLEDHIVVCGGGRTGQAVAEILAGRNASFVVVDQDPDCLERIQHHGILVHHGDATQKDTLEAVGVPRAATLISCLGDDAHNVYAILLARQMNPSINIIARATEEGSEERLRLAGADRIINPYRAGAMRLAFTALKPTVVDFLEASLPGVEGNLELTEIPVSEGSSVAGKTLAGANVRQRFGIIVVAILREGRTLFNPSPDMEIRAGDVLVGLGPPDALEGLEKASS